MEVTIFLYDEFTALDAIGPYDALRRLPDLEVRFAGLSRGLLATGGGLQLNATHSIHEIDSTDLLVLPGGGAKEFQSLIKNTEFLAWIGQMHLASKWTTSVCTGSLFLAAAGLLKGQRASTHWRAREFLANFEAVYSGQRITQSGKIITAAGVSAGIDLGIRLCELIAGKDHAKAIQLAMEYQPAPPFEIGPPDEEAELVRIIEEELRS